MAKTETPTTTETPPGDELAVLRAQLDTERRESEEVRIVLLEQADAARAKTDRIDRILAETNLASGGGDPLDRAADVLLDHRALLDRLAAAPAGSDIAPTDRIAFAVPGGDERLTIDHLWSGVTAGPAYILPGDEHGSLVALAPVVTQPKDWERRGERIVYMGEFGVTGTGLGSQAVALSHFGLAAAADGPVVAVAAAGGVATLREGTTFKFPAGSVVFG